MNDRRDRHSRSNIDACLVAVQIRFDLANAGFDFSIDYCSPIHEQRFSDELVLAENRIFAI